MKMLAVALVSTMSIVLISDAALAQGRGGNGGRSGGGGAVAPGGSAGGAHGRHGGEYAGGRYYGGGGWYGGGYRGWYGPRLGIYVGGPVYWGTWGYPYYGAYAGGYPYLAYPPSEPAVYVEQSRATSGNYWYYCRDPAGYFPYVQQCSSDWMTVVPPRGAPQSSPTPAP